MKKYLNWRYLVIVTFTTLAIILFLIAGGNDQLPLMEFAILHISAFAASVGIFVILHKCIKKWEKNGDIPKL